MVCVLLHHLGTSFITSTSADVNMLLLWLTKSAWPSGFGREVRKKPDEDRGSRFGSIMHQA